MNVNLAQLEHILMLHLWPLSRMSGLIVAMPIMTAKMIPMQIKVVLMLTLTTLCAVNLSPVMLPIFSLQAVPVLFQELLIGVMIGFSCQLLFQVFLMMGELLAMQTGLGFATLIDPTMQTNISVLSQFYNLMATLLFLSYDGHLVLIEIVFGSFEVLPINHGFDSAHYLQLALWGSWVFLSALKVALPIVIALLMLNTALGVAARSIPQLNIFSLGMPISLLVGLSFVWFTLSEVLPTHQQLQPMLFDLARTMVRLDE